MLYCKWAYFRGYIVTANDDGSIPLNSLMVMDCKYADQADAERIVTMHNELLRQANAVALMA